MLSSGAIVSRRELTKTNRQPSRRPNSGHWSSAHAASSRGSDQPRRTCFRLAPSSRHMPWAMSPPRVEDAPAQFGDGIADAVVEDERSQAAAEEAELGHSFRPQPRYLRLDVLPHRGDEIRENRRVGGHEDRRGRLVGHDVATLAAEPSYRPSQRGDGGAVRAYEDDRAGSSRSGPEFLAPEADRTRERNAADHVVLLAATRSRQHPQTGGHACAGRSARCT
jgi:hypothetical protein